ncbi:MAG: potassium-transporting ATPase subunit KdpC [Planctomycetota bacterium]
MPSNLLDRLVLRPMRPLLVLTLLTGVLYPLLVTGVAVSLWRDETLGSIVRIDGRAIGSRWIGQEFTDPGHFWGRPSSTRPRPYTAFDAAGPSGSSGSNLGPRTARFRELVRTRVDVLRAADAAAGVPGDAPIPVDLVTASASGLDPDISIAAARRQIARIAAVRAIPVAELERLIEGQVDRGPLAWLGAPVVNVLALNLELDARHLRRR